MALLALTLGLAKRVRRQLRSLLLVLLTVDRELLQILLIQRALLGKGLLPGILLFEVQVPQEDLPELGPEASWVIRDTVAKSPGVQQAGPLRQVWVGEEVVILARQGLRLRVGRHHVQGV